MDSLAFLKAVSDIEIPPVCVIHGDEAYLKRQVRSALQAKVLGDGEPSFGLTVHLGDKAVWSSVLDDLSTLPFLCPRRLVVIDDADKFVSDNRQTLEKFVVEPVATGVLVLDVKSWTSTTNLAKKLAGDATLTCKAPTTAQLPAWCVAWAASAHGKKLTSAASRLLVDLVGAEMGLLDQELAKLAVYVGERPAIDSPDVSAMVGGNNTEVIWKIFDAIAVGNTAGALTILNGLFEQQQDPLRILGGFGFQLRKLALAYRMTQQGKSLAEAWGLLGVNAWAQRGSEAQLRHLGGRRASQLMTWLTEVDLGLKGGSHLPPRTILERLVVRLARKL